MSSSLRSRRNLLQTLSIGTGVAAFAPALQAWRVRDAYAQAPTSPPRRIVFFFYPHGWSGDPPEQMAEPLKRHANDLVVLENMELKRPTNEGFQHPMGRALVWTGRYTYMPVVGRTNAIKAGGMSLDQHLGMTIGAKLTPGLPVLSQGFPQGYNVHYDSSGLTLTPNSNPYDVYNRVFRDLTIGGAAPADPALVAALARKKSVLSGVSAELSAFRKGLGPEDRLRADAQLQAISSMEARLAGLKAGGQSCKRPTVPQGIPVPDLSGKTFDQRAAAQIDLMVAAFACDLTRVQCFQCSGGGAIISFPPVNSVGTTWHTASHGGPGWAAAQRWVFELVAGLGDRLKAIPEGAGTMLDNTLIVMASEIGHGHNTDSLFMWSLGGKNMGIKVGQRLKFGQPGFGGGQSHNAWLVSMMNAMGVPGDTYGDTTAIAGKGPLPGYQV